MSSEIVPILSFGFLAFLLLFIGVRRNFFELPSISWEVPIRLRHVIGAFGIYFLITSFVANAAVSFLKNQILLNYMAYSGWLNFGISFSVFACLLVYLLILPAEVRRGIVQRAGKKYSLKEDISHAFYAWILAFPLVLFLSQALEILLMQLFRLPRLPDQIAVKFLKSTFDHPIYFSLAVLSIVILAPLIEETLFRGFLQTYIRRHLGSRQAILVTSVCFSLFHYSAGQGLGNISIIASLFVFALFLGFLYEKQGSLLSSIALHGLFNMVSVINLYLFGGFTTGI